jgi:hypothetical protein
MRNRTKIAVEILYHGTTDLFEEAIRLRGLLPPCLTGFCSERRARNRDKVFLTDSALYAEGYAIRAAHKFGGSPMVLTVEASDAVLERSGRVNQYVARLMRVIAWRVLHKDDDSLDRMISIFSA